MKRIFIFLIIIILLIPTKTFGNNEQTIQEQKDSFGITTFISKAKEYSKDNILEESDINNIFETAVNGKIDGKTLFGKIAKMLGKEFKNTIGTIATVLAIIVIHSILKSISENLENSNISKLIYYVQYILIVTIVMTNFSQIITLVKESTANMVGFINILVPLLTSLMLFTGSITTSSMIQPTLLFSVNFIGNLIQNVLIPFVLVIACFGIISKISDKIQLDKLAKFMKSGVVLFLGVTLTIFVGIVSLEGTLSSGVDGITAKTTKAVVSSAIPVVGKILGDAVDSVLGCGIILKNAVGIVGVIIIITICITPLLKLTMLTLSYKILARGM